MHAEVQNFYQNKNFEDEDEGKYVKSVNSLIFSFK